MTTPTHLRHQIRALVFDQYGTIVDMQGVAVRTGHHCAQPVMAAFSIPATARASLGMYSNRSDIDALASAIHTVREMFS